MKPITKYLMFATLALFVVTGSAYGQSKAKKSAKAHKEASMQKSASSHGKQMKEEKSGASKSKSEKAAKTEHKEAARMSTSKEHRTESKSASSSSRMSPSGTTGHGSDKVIGKDDKGHTLYEGPRGGHYYINANGHKTYVKH